MSLTPGARLGPYEILAPVGAGGMGEVYKGRDTRLDRPVAIKVLPAHVASDPERKQRFEREAKTLAALSHPHICPVFDVGQQDGVDFLVMEYLEGETLAQRLTKGALPLDQALQYAIQIADALDKAHRQRITHRDLKPGNLMLTKSGVKLLDFGLAKLRERDAGPAGRLSALPTQEPDLTGEGAILGTLQYMAPEQLEGTDADARTDIFAFGAVVYEMVTGKKAFEGKSQASLISAIMSADPPPLAAIQPLTPQQLDHVVRKCLAKNADERWQSAHDIRSDLQWIAGGDGRISEARAATGRTRERVAWAVAGATIAAAIGLIVWLVLRPRSEPAPAISFQISAPAGTTFSSAGPANPHQALSPDGRHLAFLVVTTDGRSVLAVRSLDSTQPQVLTRTEGIGSEGAGLPFWSPDSRSIGFFAEGKLKKIDATGGSPPQVLCDAPSGEGGTWNSDGTILFARDGTGGLFRVAATGGSPSPVTTLDVASKEESHRLPWFLPDGRHFLYVAIPPTTVYAGSLDSPERVKVIASDSKAIYTQGHLLFARQGTLLAQPFDAARLKITGDSFPVAENVGVNPSNTRAAFSASATGVLTYRPSSDRFLSQLAWVDRAGKQLGTLNEQAADYTEPELSPDGNQAAVSVRHPTTRTADIWLYNIARGLRTRLTFDPENNVGPRWSPDGGSIVFRTGSSNRTQVILKPSSGVGGQQVLLESKRNEYPDSWSPDGRFILYELDDPKTTWDLWILPLPDRKPRPFLQMEFRQEGGRFSPDGRWIAYRSTESGRSEVYVVPFPGPGGKWQISARGGTSPKWSRDGKELFFIGPDNMFTVATVNGQGPAFEVGAVTPLFAARFATDSNFPYDVSPDGRRFLVTTLVEQAELPMTVVVNWTALLKK